MRSDELLKVESEIAVLAKKANKGCGISYELFAQNFHVMVMSKIIGLPEDKKDLILTTAKKHGYLSAEELQQETVVDSDGLYCVHGIDRHACPAGCSEQLSGMHLDQNILVVADRKGYLTGFIEDEPVFGSRSHAIKFDTESACDMCLELDDGEEYIMSTVSFA